MPAYPPKRAPDPSHDRPGAKAAEAAREETREYVAQLLRQVIALANSELRIAFDAWEKRQ